MAPLSFRFCGVTSASMRLGPALCLLVLLNIVGSSHVAGQTPTGTTTGSDGSMTPAGAETSVATSVPTTAASVDSDGQATMGSTTLASLQESTASLADAGSTFSTAQLATSDSVASTAAGSAGGSTQPMSAWNGTTPETEGPQETMQPDMSTSVSDAGVTNAGDSQVPLATESVTTAAASVTVAANEGPRDDIHEVGGPGIITVAAFTTAAANELTPDGGNTAPGSVPESTSAAIFTTAAANELTPDEGNTAPGSVPESTSVAIFTTAAANDLTPDGGDTTPRSVPESTSAAILTTAAANELTPDGGNTAPGSVPESTSAAIFTTAAANELTPDGGNTAPSSVPESTSVAILTTAAANELTPDGGNTTPRSEPESTSVAIFTTQAATELTSNGGDVNQSTIPERQDTDTVATAVQVSVDMSTSSTAPPTSSEVTPGAPETPMVSGTDFSSMAQATGSSDGPGTVAVTPASHSTQSQENTASPAASTEPASAGSTQLVTIEAQTTAASPTTEVAASMPVATSAPVVDGTIGYSVGSTPPSATAPAAAQTGESTTSGSSPETTFTVSETPSTVQTVDRHTTGWPVSTAVATSAETGLLSTQGPLFVSTADTSAAVTLPSVDSTTAAMSPSPIQVESTSEVLTSVQRPVVKPYQNTTTTAFLTDDGTSPFAASTVVPTEALSAVTSQLPAETTPPSAKTTLPPAETTLPPAETTLPPAETTLPPAETTLPPTETTLPPAETTQLPAETTQTTVATTQPSVVTTQTPAAVTTQALAETTKLAETTLQPTPAAATPQPPADLTTETQRLTTGVPVVATFMPSKPQFKPLSTLTEEEKKGTFTVESRGIMRDNWLAQKDVIFRNTVAPMLRNKSRKRQAPSTVQAEDIVYVSPSPVVKDGVLHITFFARSRGGDSGESVIDGNQVVGILNTESNMNEMKTALKVNDIKVYPGISSAILLQDTQTGVSIFGSRALFIGLIAIGCLSLVIIVAGFIYLVCDRKRGRSGEYITHHVNPDLEVGLDNPALMTEAGDKTAAINGNGAHLLSFKTDPEDGDIVPYNSFSPEDLANCEVEDTHL
ncbi:mucin-17-like isoform X2 [Acanthaster planci]|uniref:Mucin-17-like isoform X2 n=1 Tax=Acanthaster planci TaxID=133434 RepID=A0A8B7XLZ3_ACAPL|nr:mucin-17-like isoform X2 [Acanthaster planci]